MIELGDRLLSKKLSHEEFRSRIEKIHPEIEFLTEYTNAKTKVQCRCRICAHVWSTSPDSLNQGCGCPNCANIKKRSQKVKSHNLFIEELKNINPQIKVLEKYTNAKTKILCLCLIDGHQWYASPDNLLHGYGCPKCAGKTTTTESFKEKMHYINPDIELLGEYKTNNTKIKCLCRKHNYIFYMTPSKLSRGQGCTKCRSEKCGNARRLSYDEFSQKLSSINPNIEVVGSYVNSHTRILVKCKKCGKQWSINPNNALIRGVKCACEKVKGKPKGESIIFDFLQTHNIDFYYQYSFPDLTGINGGLLSYDFYLFDLGILIEFQGMQHEKPVDYFGGKDKFEIQQEHDKRKRDYATEHNIKLLEIWYYDINSIENILRKNIDFSDYQIA